MDDTSVAARMERPLGPIRAEIDTLIWLDMTVRAECMTPRPTYEQYMKVTVMECAVRNETIP